MTQQYTPNQIAAMLANPQYRGQAEQFLREQFGRIAPQASERTYTLRGMTSSDDNGTLTSQTPYYTDQNISSWYAAGDWTAGREGRFAGTQAPTGDFMAIMPTPSQRVLTTPHPDRTLTPTTSMTLERNRPAQQAHTRTLFRPLELQARWVAAQHTKTVLRTTPYA